MAKVESSSLFIRFISGFSPEKRILLPSFLPQGREAIFLSNGQTIQGGLSYWRTPMKKLRQILASEGLLKTSALDSSLQGPILALDLNAFAQALYRMYGDEARWRLDDMRRDILFFGEENGLSKQDVAKLLYGADDAIFEIRMAEKDRAIAQSPWKKELKTLKDVFTSVVGPGDVPYIKWQPRLQKGQFVGATLIDMGGVLGNMRATVDESWARQNGTTLKKVFEALDAMGGQMVSRGLGPGRKKPWIGHDGWAY